MEGETLVEELGRLATFVASLPLHDRIFLGVSLLVAVLLFLTLLFTSYALYLRGRNVLKERRWRGREERWTDLVLQVLSETAPPDTLRRGVGRGEQLAFLDFLLRYARRLRGPERRKLEELAVPFLPALIPQLREEDLYSRARAVQTLGSLGLPEYRKEVARALDDEAPFVAMVAARALASTGTPEDRTRIVERLHRFDHWSVEYLASLLTEMGPEVAPELRRVMASPDQPVRVRKVTAEALHDLHDLEAADAAAAALSGEGDPELQVSLLRILAKLGRPEHAERVRRYLRSESSPVRGVAFKALGILGGGDDLESLRAGLYDPSPWVALDAARALRRLGGEEGLRNLSGSDHPRAALAAQVLEEGT